MSDQLFQGLMLSIVGMGLTFLVLGILILVMVLLDRLFRDDKKVESAEAIRAERAAIGTSTREPEEKEVVAAIAAALAHLRSLEICEAGLGSTLATPASRWWLELNKVLPMPYG